MRQEHDDLRTVVDIGDALPYGLEDSGSILVTRGNIHEGIARICFLLRAICIQLGEEAEHGIQFCLIEFFEMQQVLPALYDTAAADGSQLHPSRIDRQGDQSVGGDTHTQIPFYFIIQIKNPLDERRRQDFEEGVTIL